MRQGWASSPGAQLRSKRVDGAGGEPGSIESNGFGIGYGDSADRSRRELAGIQWRRDARPIRRLSEFEQRTWTP